MTDPTLADLRAAQLFAQLDDEQLARIAAIARPVLLPAERTLFLQGDPASAFYLLSEGRLKVFKLLRDGRTATIRHVEAGQTFAEAALFHEEYPSSTETLTDCRLYRFDTQEVLQLLLAEPQVAVDEDAPRSKSSVIVGGARQVFEGQDELLVAHAGSPI